MKIDQQTFISSMISFIRTGEGRCAINLFRDSLVASNHPTSSFQSSANWNQSGYDAVYHFTQWRSISATDCV